MKLGLFAVVAVLCVLASGLAEARPRDEVMSGAFRCAAIGDSRVWLDCYYGAAEPARAQLDLALAPAAQIRLARSPPPGTPADNSVRYSVMSGAFRCNGVADDRQWLDCFYGAAQPMRAQLGLSPAPQARVATLEGRPMVPAENLQVMPATRKKRGGWFSDMFEGDDGQPKTTEQQFGKPTPDKVGASADVDHVVSRMAAYSFDNHGMFTATLANGQVWRQLSGDTDYAVWKKPAINYIVSISRGWFGSYNFQVKDNPGMFKVQRDQ